MNRPISAFPRPYWPSSPIAHAACHRPHAIEELRAPETESARGPSRLHRHDAEEVPRHDQRTSTPPARIERAERLLDEISRAHFSAPLGPDADHQHVLAQRSFLSRSFFPSNKALAAGVAVEAGPAGHRAPARCRRPSPSSTAGYFLRFALLDHRLPASITVSHAITVCTRCRLRRPAAPAPWHSPRGSPRTLIAFCTSPGSRRGRRWWGGPEKRRTVCRRRQSSRRVHLSPTQSPPSRMSSRCRPLSAPARPKPRSAGATTTTSLTRGHRRTQRRRGRSPARRRRRSGSRRRAPPRPSEEDISKSRQHGRHSHVDVGEDAARFSPSTRSGPAAHRGWNETKIWIPGRRRGVRDLRRAGKRRLRQEKPFLCRRTPRRARGARQQHRPRHGTRNRKDKRATGNHHAKTERKKNRKTHPPTNQQTAKTPSSPA